jgi:hypothetical protein
VLDLDMAPDPARQGERIRKWTIRLRADGNGECATRITVWDKDQVAGNAVRWTLKAGDNVIEVPGNPGYQMQRNDHCFTVIADIQNTPKHVDASRSFCAKMEPAVWTLKGVRPTAGDRPASPPGGRGTLQGDQEQRPVSR